MQELGSIPPTTIISTHTHTQKVQTNRVLNFLLWIHYFLDLIRRSDLTSKSPAVIHDDKSRDKWFSMRLGLVRDICIRMALPSSATKPSDSFQPSFIVLGSAFEHSVCLFKKGSTKWVIVCLYGLACFVLFLFCFKIKKIIR